MRKMTFARLIAAVLFALSTAAISQEKWAAIVGSSDRSAVGAASNQPTKSQAITVATGQCKANARTKKSSDTVRSVWSGPKCEPIVTPSGRQQVCNK